MCICKVLKKYKGGSVLRKLFYKIKKILHLRGIKVKIPNSIDEYCRPVYYNTTISERKVRKIMKEILKENK